MARGVRVAELATEADVDLDEALVALWDAGVDVEDETSLIDGRAMQRARSALGVDTPRAQIRVDYWMKRLDLTREELAERLRTMGIDLPERTRTLPKGALRRLRRAYLFAPTVAEKQIETKLDSPGAPPFEWHTIGVQRDVKYLDERDVRLVHERLAIDFAEADDPISPPGVRSEDLLSSALSRPKTSLGGELKYKSVEMAGAALLHSLVLNHPFHNGNKRAGLVSLLVFLDRNSFWPTCDEQALFKFVLKVAAHGLVPMSSSEVSDREVLEIASWIKQNSRLTSRGERPLQWHKLKRILRPFGCTFEHASVGNRLNIARTVEGQRRLRRRQTQLVTQVHYGGEGTVVDKNTLHKIRADLHLDEDHGCDSKNFYETDTVPADFITQYRTLLRRLGRL